MLQIYGSFFSKNNVNTNFTISYNDIHKPLISFSYKNRGFKLKHKKRTQKSPEHSELSYNSK